LNKDPLDDVNLLQSMQEKSALQYCCRYFLVLLFGVLFNFFKIAYYRCLNISETVSNCFAVRDNTTISVSNNYFVGIDSNILLGEVRYLWFLTTKKRRFICL